MVPRTMFMVPRTMVTMVPRTKVTMVPRTMVTMVLRTVVMVPRTMVTMVPRTMVTMVPNTMVTLNHGYHTSVLPWFSVPWLPWFYVQITIHHENHGNHGTETMVFTWYIFVREIAAVTAQVVADLLKNTEFVNLLDSIVSSAVERKIDDLLTKVESLQGQMSMKDNKIGMLNKAVADQSTEISSLNLALDSLEQYSRRSSIRILGVEEKQGEDTEAVVKEIITTKLGVSLEPSCDIDRLHRTGSARTTTTTARPRSIIVKMQSYKKRREILLNRRKLKGTGIPIVEDLTVKKQSLLAKTRAHKKVISAWSSDGRIFASLPASGGKSVRKLIRNEEDLQLL